MTQHIHSDPPYWHQTPPDSADNDLQLGVGAADGFPPLSGQHSEREEYINGMRHHIRNRDNGWKLMQWALVQIGGR